MDKIIGTKWETVDGIKEVVGYYNNNKEKLLVKLVGSTSKIQEIINRSELDSIINFDTKRKKQHDINYMKRELKHEKERLEKKEKENTYGFADKLLPMQKSKVLNTLLKVIRYKNKEMTRKELIENEVKNGAKVITYKGERILQKENESTFFDEKTITKIGMNYADYLVKNNKL